MRAQHDRDAGHPDDAVPDAVAYPATTAEGAALVGVCPHHGRPVIPYGEGIVATRADFDARGLTAPILGHVGDGNFHCFILFDPDAAAAQAANAALVGRAIGMAGTCTGEHGIGTGEHGIGTGKQGFLVANTARGSASCAMSSARSIPQACSTRAISSPTPEWAAG